MSDGTESYQLVKRGKCIPRKDLSLHLVPLWRLDNVASAAKGPSSDFHHAKLHWREARSSIQCWCKFMHPPSDDCQSSAHPIYMHPYIRPLTAKLFAAPKLPILRNSLSNALDAGCSGKLAGRPSVSDSTNRWLQRQATEDIYIKSLFREVSEHLWCDGKREIIHQNIQ